MQSEQEIRQLKEELEKPAGCRDERYLELSLHGHLVHLYDAYKLKDEADVADDMLEIHRLLKARFGRKPKHIAKLIEIRTQRKPDHVE